MAVEAVRIEPIDIEEEVRSSFLDYAMSVIVSRALPDVRDGLKPVHRRILWSMLEQGIRPDRPTKKSARVVRDIGAETVDFQPNYDGGGREPVVMPARFPNLLVNGPAGIEVGMATNMPPHNLGEIIDAVVATIDDPDITQAKLERIVKGPDFPT